MIRRIYARNFRCLQSIDVELQDSFQILIGPNASGKSAFMDVIAFLADFASKGLVYAIDNRAEDFRDLLWQPGQQSDPTLLLGIELDFKSLLSSDSDNQEGGRLGYEIELEWDEGVRVTTEKAELRRPDLPRVTFSRDQDGIRYEIAGDLSGHRAVIDCGHDESMFDVIQAELSSGPTINKPLAKAFIELKQLLNDRVNYVNLESKRMRRPSPRRFRNDAHFCQDGSNFPWLVDHLKRDHNESYEEWVRHVQTVLPQIERIHVRQREWQNDAYIDIEHRNGVCTPSWLLSEGALRLMALTLIAYLPVEAPYIFLIEEPENGLHPYAIDAIYDSLSSVYESHVLVSTYSPLLLSKAEPREVFCFSRRDTDGAKIKLGSDYPKSANWRNAIHNHLLFSSL